MLERDARWWAIYTEIVTRRYDTLILQAARLGPDLLVQEMSAEISFAVAFADLAVKRALETSK